MAKGKQRQEILGVQGIVQSQTGPDWSFIYRASTVKADEYNVGDTVRLPDRREYTYAKSKGACAAEQACEFTNTGLVAYTAFATSHAIGVQEITVPAATHAVQTLDSLRGGYVIIHNGSGTYTQVRGIVGNAAHAANVAFKCQLDGPLSTAIVSGTSAIELYANPYTELQAGATTTLCKAGLPAVTVTAADVYFWVQTRGFCFINPQSGVDAAETGLMFRHDGSVQDIETSLAVTTADYTGTQVAGYRAIGGYSGNGPLMFLTL